MPVSNWIATGSFFNSRKHVKLGSEWVQCCGSGSKVAVIAHILIRRVVQTDSLV